MNFTFAGALRGAGDTHWTAGLIVLLSFVLFAPLSVGAVLFTNLESLGPWLAGTIYSIILGSALWRRFALGKWRDIDIFAGEMKRPTTALSQEMAG
jgi:Na+-driven multidrug efflux pump